MKVESKTMGTPNQMLHLAKKNIEIAKELCYILDIDITDLI